MGAAFDDYGRMSGKLGLEIPFVNAFNQNFVLQTYVDPATELLTDSVTTGVPVAGDGTQIWKITHNGVDTHPIHFHLFDVQLINRVGWDGAIRVPDATELGWKETVRISPLEDTIVALRPVSPKHPFGLPDSIRPLNPAKPLGSVEDFSGLDPYTGTAVTTVNTLYNFGWEYVWHCHILSHEEMDMMRPMAFNVGRALPFAPVLTATTGGGVALTWTDGTPVSSASTLGNPQNEIGFRIERAIGAAGAFVSIGTALANATTFTDTTATPATMLYRYRVVAFNAAGDAPSNIVIVGPPPPAAPSGLTATALLNPLRVALSWTDNANNETGFEIQRATGAAGAFATIATVGANAITYTDTTVLPSTTYRYQVRAVNAAGNSAFSNIATVTTPSLIPAAPTNLAGTAVRITGNILQDRVTLTWSDNANNETGFQIQRALTSAFLAPTTYNVGANVTTFQQNVSRIFDYYYRVRAVNASGNSAWSNVRLVTTP